ncbi:MAG: helix-turn-helix domain-containing protein [Xanthomonadales bacterium]|nr:helix-turn-helix domain-containing protein [Xanthomonadales bacterium]MBN8794816.1 helix-turn-helix domain-containing protein [Stenotrophomonas nitritireducens]
MAAEIRIGQLAKVTQTTPPTIRYYEGIGLLPAPPRQAGSQRVYGDADVRRLTFIRRCREFGFPIEKVRLLVSLVQNRDRACMEARDLAFAHLTEVRQKLHELQELERSIAAFVKSCDHSCAGGVGADCVMLEELSEGSTIAPPAGRGSCCSPGTLAGAGK